MILAAVKTNASNTGRTDVLDVFRTNAVRFFIGAMSTFMVG
jgi:hypothetical protein